MNPIIPDISRENPLSRPVLWALFGSWLLIATYSMLHHEMWADELHSWNIAKGSAGFFDLISNRRYEGHPPGWYIICWLLSKATHELIFLQLVHLLIASLVVFVLLFFSPLPLSAKILLPFGYYFLYEYAVLSRNYAIAVLAAFLICLIIRKTFKYKLLLYYGLLFLMSNTHLLALLLAGSMQVYFLMMTASQQEKPRRLLLHLFASVAIFLPAVYFISSPPDSATGIFRMMSNWSFSRLDVALQTPLRAFLPMPAWWEYHFWNRQCLLELDAGSRAMKWLSPLLALAFAGLGYYLLRGSKKCQLLFLINTLLTVLVGNIYLLATQRYAGFIFIGFIVAYWLQLYEQPVRQHTGTLINILLIFQLVAGVFITAKDIRLPFSNLYRVKEVLDRVPQGSPVVTDYWTLNAISAYTDKPFYALLAQKKLSFLTLGADIDLGEIKNYPNIYCHNLDIYFRKEKINSVYMIASQSPSQLSAIDPALFSSFDIRIADKTIGAIEIGSDLYLYKISKPLP